MKTFETLLPFAFLSYVEQFEHKLKSKLLRLHLYCCLATHPGSPGSREGRSTWRRMRELSRAWHRCWGDSKNQSFRGAVSLVDFVIRLQLHRRAKWNNSRRYLWSNAISVCYKSVRVGSGILRLTASVTSNKHKKGASRFVSNLLFGILPEQYHRVPATHVHSLCSILVAWLQIQDKVSWYFRFYKVRSEYWGVVPWTWRGFYKTFVLGQ